MTILNENNINLAKFTPLKDATDPKRTPLP